MTTQKQAKDYYDDFSSWYEKERHHGYHAMLDRLEMDVLRPLAANREVLEVGAGTGLILNGVSQVATKAVGLDISSGMLKSAKEKGHEVVQGSATELPFENDSFDLAYSLKVLAHIPNIEQALSEMARVVRPGGMVVAEFYNAHSIRHLAKTIGTPGRISENRTEAEIFTRWDTPEDVLSYLPSSLTFMEWRGVRVFTPAAAVFRLPLVNSLLPKMEQWAVRFKTRSLRWLSHRRLSQE